MFGAPAWFNTDRVDVNGRAPQNTPAETFQQMLKTLLIQEFKVVFHTEQRAMNAFALTVGRGGPKRQRTAGTGEEDYKGAEGRGQQFGGTHVACTNMKMSDLADELSGFASSYIDKTVVDQTGLTETYGIALDWVERNNIDTTGGLPIFGALEKLGLKLEEKKPV